MTDIGNHTDPTHVGDVDTFMGFDVNDFTSVTSYGVFNDPETFVIGDIVNTEALQDRLFGMPLMEDDDLERIQRHADLSNDDRERNGQKERVIIKKMVRLETKWTAL